MILRRFQTAALLMTLPFSHLQVNLSKFHTIFGRMRMDRSIALGLVELLRARVRFQSRSGMRVFSRIPLDDFPRFICGWVCELPEVIVLVHHLSLCPEF